MSIATSEPSTKNAARNSSITAGYKSNTPSSSNVAQDPSASSRRRRARELTLKRISVEKIAAVGAIDGADVVVGPAVGAAVGGTGVGTGDGMDDGSCDGSGVGTSDGAEDGSCVGAGVVARATSE